MRDDIARFAALGATVVAVAPHSTGKVAKFTRDDEYPFPMVADPSGSTFRAYDVLSKLSSLGQRPAVFVVDRTGTVRLDAVGTKMTDIADVETVLEVLAGL